MDTLKIIQLGSLIQLIQVVDWMKMLPLPLALMILAYYVKRRES